MPTKGKPQPQVGSLVQCRLTTGTFTYTATRKIARVLSQGRRFVLEGSGNPIVERKSIVTILRALPIS
jgi:hypothetical protein